MAIIVKQPGDRFAVVSHSVIALWDATGDEVIAWFVEEARRDAARAVERAEHAAGENLAHVDKGRPQQAYGQFAMTWEEALHSDRRHDGEAHKAFPPPPPGDACPDCGSELDAQPGGGVKCSECPYWFCF